MYSNQIPILPSTFDCKFTLNRQIHSYNTRNSHAFRLPFCRTNIQQFSIFLRRSQILQHLNYCDCELVLPLHPSEKQLRLLFVIIISILCKCVKYK